MNRRRKFIRVRRGTDAFDAWCGYWRRNNPRLAAASENALVAVVPTRWPPGFAPPRRTQLPPTLHRTRQAAGERSHDETTTNQKDPK